MKLQSRMGCEDIIPVLDHIPGFAYLQRRDFTISYANSYFLERFGDYSEKRCHQIFYGSAEACPTCLTAEVFESLKPREQEWEAPDGRTYLVYDTPFLNSGESPQVLRVGVDITLKKQSDEEAAKARNLESLFVFARGIAHDFNNILTSILGNISLGKIISHPGDKMFGILAAAEKSSIQARDLVNQFLLFAKLGNPCRQKFAVRDLLNETDMGSIVPEVSCTFSLPADLWHVNADKGQISLVFNNLFSNACRALPRGGAIHVDAENIYVQGSHPLPLDQGSYVKIDFRDNGNGISREYISRIFDPYMTTQEMGQQKGVGLGLTMCYTILKNHGGYITAESKPDSGTVFSVYLPGAGSDYEI